MNDDRLDDLIDAHLNGVMDDAERRELEERLLHSASDRTRFWTLAETHVMTFQGIQQKLTETSGLAAMMPRVTRMPLRSLQIRPLTAAAAGLVIGILSASMMFAYASPKLLEVRATIQNILIESFESDTVRFLPGLTRETGVWSGDETRIVTAELGLQPVSGTKMLRFISATFAGENAKLNAWSDLYRLVDLRGRVGNEKSVVRLTGSFYAAPFPAEEEYACRVEVCAFEDDLTDATLPLALAWVRENCSSEAKRKFTLKGDGLPLPATVEVPVSPQTQFILVHLAVQRRRPHRPADAVTFGRHYLDDVKLELITLPNQFLLEEATQ